MQHRRNCIRAAIAGARGLCHAAAMIPFSQLRERTEQFLFDRHDLPVKPANWLLDFLRFPFALIRDLVAGELNLRAMGLVYTTLLLSARPARRFCLCRAEGPRRAPRPRAARSSSSCGRSASARVRADDAVHAFRGQRARRRAGLGRPRHPALYGHFHDPEARGGVQFRLARGAAALRHAPRQRSTRASWSSGRCSSSSYSACFSAVASQRPMQWLAMHEPFGTIARAFGIVGPFLFVTGVFTFLYAFIPNTRVRLKPALIGGVVAGCCGPRAARCSRASSLPRPRWSRSTQASRSSWRR